MKVNVKQPFIGVIDGVKYRGIPGDVIELPKGADWIEAGLVEPVATKITKRRRKTTKAA